MRGVPGAFRPCVAEALGTAVLVLLGPGAVMVASATHAFSHAGVAPAFGLAVALVVTAFGNRSDAHINPAVSVALWSVGKFPGRMVPPYIASQLLGPAIAAAILRWLLGPVAGLGATVPVLDVPRSFLVEAGYSGLLAFVILAVATDTRVPKAVAPFAIGATVFVGALVTAC